MYGHSLGGVNVASSMYEDRRFKAGIDIDGGAAGPVVNAGIDRPVLLVDGPKSTRAKLPDLQVFWTRLRGWHRDIALTGSGHATFTDFEFLIPQIAPLLHATPDQVREEIGTIPPDRALAWQRAYPRAFFDLTLRHLGHLLDGPSRDYPEVAFIP